MIIAGICGIVYICKANPKKPESSKPAITKQSVIQEPISTPELIIESEPTNNNESKIAEDEIILSLVIHIVSILFIPAFLIVFTSFTKSLLQRGN